MFLSTAAGPIEWAQFGGDPPCTIFAHGLGNSIDITRPFASGVPGRRVFLHFRGHGASCVPPGEWTYADLADELRAVADHADATQALGVSMGSGALLALLAQTPDRFARLVLVLPAGLDRPRDAAAVARADVLADLVDAGDATGLARELAADQAAPPQAGPAVALWAARHAEWMLDSGVAVALRQVPRRAPVADPAALAAVTAPVLVLAQEQDPVHPVALAEAVAAALPQSDLRVFPPGGLLWAHRARLREIVAGFLRGD